MILYLSVIISCIIILSVLNIAFFLPMLELSAIQTIGIVILTIVAELAINGIFAWLVHSLPNKWFLPEHKFFKVNKKERKFYEKLGIKKWKDKIWELGGLGGFRKNKINDPNNPEYFTMFLIESNKGIMVHIVGIFVSFLCAFVYPAGFLTIGLPASIVGVILNVLPILVLRYNIPKLQVARERSIRLSKNNIKNNIVNTDEVISQKN